MTCACLRCLLLAAAACVLPAHAQVELRHDPFARPTLAAAANPQTSGGANITNPDVPWNPQLTSVMLAGKDSMVTVDGVIVSLGEKIDGHRLIQVRDHEAVFQKGRKRIVLTMGIANSKSAVDRGRR